MLLNFDTWNRAIWPISVREEDRQRPLDSGSRWIGDR